MNTTSALCLSEEANVAAKHKFRAALLKAIAKNDVQAFKSCVEQIGKDWGVCRNVETVNKDAFGEALWNKREAILLGAYDGWENSKYSAYSYESKVCFLLNPLHYKVIYDSRTKEALNESDRGKWQERVERYYRETIRFAPEDDTDIDRIFREDYQLWARESEKLWLCGSNGRFKYKLGVTAEAARELSV